MIFLKMCNRIKKFFAAACFFVLAAAACGCTAGNNYTGREYVEKAQSLHTSLESAHISVKDNVSGAVAQDITYRFVGDVMQYMYIGTDAEKNITYYEFNNGTELDTLTLPGDTGWSFASKGSDGYYSYSRASRHYFADGAKLLAASYEQGISEASLYDRDGGKRLDITYSNEKLKVYENIGVTDMKKYYIFDAEGYCTESGLSFRDSDGSFESYTTLIERRDEKAAIERISPDLGTESGEQGGLDK